VSRNPAHRVFQIVDPRLHGISVLSGSEYSVVFDTSEGLLEIECRVTLEPVPAVRAEPDLFSEGRLGDPRLVAAAVLAFHRARNRELSP
jgi:hypothetical protein